MQGTVNNGMNPLSEVFRNLWHEFFPLDERSDLFWTGRICVAAAPPTCVGLGWLAYEGVLEKCTPSWKERKAGPTQRFTAWPLTRPLLCLLTFSQWTHLNEKKLGEEKEEERREGVCVCLLGGGFFWWMRPSPVTFAENAAVRSC